MPGGQSTGLGQGSVGFGIAIRLVGVGIVASQGAIEGHKRGIINVEQGSLTFRSEHGQQFLSSQGSLGAALRPTNITTQLISTGQGTLTAGGQPVTVHISGVEAQSQQGIVVIGPVLLDGTQAALSAGSVVQGREMPLGGMVATLSAGTVAANIEADDTFVTSSHGSASPELSAALIGVELAVTHGALSVIDKEEPLIGQATTLAQGALGRPLEFALSGQQMLAEMYPFGAPGEAALTGATVTVEQGTVDEHRLVGEVITVSAGDLGAGQELSGLASTVSAGIVLPEGGIPARFIIDAGRPPYVIFGEEEDKRHKRRHKVVRKRVEELFKRAERPEVREEISKAVARHINRSAEGVAQPDVIPVVWSSLYPDEAAVDRLLELYRQQVAEVRDDEEEAIALLLL